ncbi:MAG: UDP-N-acetylmuramoyl-tripeptide--D-alanyl-D-alanine ligase [Solirubrobacterales bacterium]
MAALILNKPVIAVTGSSGKSTTKEMISSILETRWRVFKSVENHNLYWETQKYAKQIKPEHDAVVLEYGMIYHGRIKRHCQAIRPNIGIITMIGTAHAGNLGGVAGVVKAKSEMIQYMDPNGTLLLNADDRHSQKLPFKRFGGRLIWIGIDQPADYRAKDIRFTRRGMRFVAEYRSQAEWFEIPVLGLHNIYNALYAIAVADRLGFRPSEIRAGFRRFKQLDRRLTVHRLGHGITLLDDTFSANPNAVMAAIDVLKQLGGGRKVAVLGSMLELGELSERGHKRVGRWAAKRGVDQLVTYGKAARWIDEGAVQAGLSPDCIKHFESKTALKAYVRGLVKPNTTILFKASHDMRLDMTVRFVLKGGKNRAKPQEDDDA